MLKSKKKIERHVSRVLVLRTQDEMGTPYANALATLDSRVEWFTTYKELLSYPETSDPMVVVVDLDCLAKPVDAPLEQLRVGFAGSDLIALSGTDSAQLAMQCLRAGFTDFLLKPTSPEELTWSIRRCHQRSDLVQKLESRTDVLRSLTQISSCSTPNLVRLSVLEFVKSLTNAAGAAWLKPEKSGKDVAKVLAKVPQGPSDAGVLSKLPTGPLTPAFKSRVLRTKTGRARKLLIPGQHYQEGIVFVWGIDHRVGPSVLAEARLIVEHGEQSLLNINKYEEIRQQTFIDDLTGLYNSRYLKYALGNSMAKCKAPADCFSVLFIDVDHFKTVNDGNGHLVGSGFLVAIGKSIRNIVRNIDPVFRYGGDEFVVILQGTALEGAQEIGERIRKAIEKRVFVIRGKKLQTTVSIGIATYPHHASERDMLLKLADEAMYSAKKHTRNAVHLAVEPTTTLTARTRRAS